MRTIEYVSPAAIIPNPRNAHTHSKKQIEQIARSIDAFGFTVPVIIDETSMLLAGHGRFEAAKLRGLEEIPAIRLRGLSEARTITGAHWNGWAFFGLKRPTKEVPANG